MQPSRPGPVAEEPDPIGEQNHRHRRRQRESTPGRQSAPIAGAQQPDRDAHLARCGAGQKLAQRNQIRIAAIVEPVPPGHELFAEIAEMRDRAAEGGETSRRKTASTSRQFPCGAAGAAAAGSAVVT
jgi:hypothetical protein